MTEIVGGLRARLLHDSLFNTVDAGLGELGWYDPDRRHQPLRLVDQPAREDETVSVNTMAMDVRTVDLFDLEVGSGLTQDDIAVVFDFYAENDSVGFDVTNDVRDLLRGRLDVGPQRASFDLQDYRQDPPVKIGYATVDEVRVERPAAVAVQEWRRHWYQIRCVVHDAYTDDFAASSALVTEDGGNLLTEDGDVLTMES